MEGQLAQPRYREEGLGPVSSDVTDFADFLWEAFTSLREWNGGWGEGEDGGEGGGEGEETGVGM